MAILGILKFFILGVCVGILVYLIYESIRKFFKPAKDAKAELGKAIDSLRKLKISRKEAFVDLDEIGNSAMVSDALKHLWAEYCETLHPQYITDANGFTRVSQYRSTAMAEAFFTEQALVDSPLQTEYFKNLPGICTGIGIIGTFTGLILGLKNFAISSNPEVVRAGLQGLIGSVGDAFCVSAFAIFLAMLFTYFEKRIVSSSYKQVEELCQLIDSLFNAGAGEEYLARLVSAAETSATQALQIKDSLVTELKQILNEVTAKQVEASARHSLEMSNTISRSFTENMSEPMARISRAVEHVGASQGDAINTLLTDVLANFSSRMESFFGGQLTGVSELLVKTATLIESTTGRFDAVANNLQSAGEGAANAMAEKLAEAINKMERHQEVMNARLGDFIATMRSLADESQTESTKKIQEVLGLLGENVNAVVDNLKEQVQQGSAEGQARQEAMTARMDEFFVRMQEVLKETQSSTTRRMQDALADIDAKTVSLLGTLEQQVQQGSEAENARQEAFVATTTATVKEVADLVKGLIEEVRVSSTTMKDSVVSLTSATKTTIDKFMAGAETLYVATSEFSKAGDGIKDTLKATEKATNAINNSAMTLTGTTANIKAVLQDTDRSREQFSRITNDLSKIIDNARREAGLTTELVNELKEGARHLAAAQGQAEAYLESVTRVLGDVHEEFADKLQRSLEKGHNDFHHQLSQSVLLLNGAIKNLGDTLESLPVQE